VVQVQPPASPQLLTFAIKHTPPQHINCVSKLNQQAAAAKAQATQAKGSTSAGSSHTSPRFAKACVQVDAAVLF
jgi:hypothetical protein